MPQRRGKIYLSQINKWILKTQIQQKEFTYLYTILPKIFLPCDQKWVKVAQSCLTLCDPMDYSPPCSSVHGILQARILEWVAMPFSKGSSQPRGQTQVSHSAGRSFLVWANRDLTQVSPHSTLTGATALPASSSCYLHPTPQPHCQTNFFFLNFWTDHPLTQTDIKYWFIV